MSDLNDAPSDPRANYIMADIELKERVRIFLNDQLKSYGLECDNLYINTVHDVIEPKLTLSQPLHDAAIESLKRKIAPTYSMSLSGVFSKGWTYEDAHRIRKPSVIHVEKIIQNLLDHAQYKWFL